MAVTDYNGKEKASLKNIKALWQHITGGVHSPFARRWV